MHLLHTGNQPGKDDGKIAKELLENDSASGATAGQACDAVMSFKKSPIPVSAACCYELCSGIVDKKKSLLEMARDEVLEECGYSVPLDTIRLITSYQTGIGTSGSRQWLYYAEVNLQTRSFLSCHWLIYCTLWNILFLVNRWLTFCLMASQEAIRLNVSQSFALVVLNQSFYKILPCPKEKTASWIMHKIRTLFLSWDIKKSSLIALRCSDAQSRATMLISWYCVIRTVFWFYA